MTCDKCGRPMRLIYRWRFDRLYECVACLWRQRVNERLP